LVKDDFLIKILRDLPAVTGVRFLDIDEKEFDAVGV
jgi:hypothetical protein